MKKSTVIVILLIYFASILVVGLFGMSVRGGGVTQYVASIEMDVKAENENMFDFSADGIDENGNHKYTLFVNFKDAHLIDEKGNPYIVLTFIPFVTYDDGDRAGEEEKIVYSINSTFDYEENGYISLAQNGQMNVYKTQGAFDILVKPENSGRYGNGALISVYLD